MESFQDLSLEDSQCWESMELSTESFKTMGAIILSGIFSGSSCLKMTISWQLSVKSTKTMGAIVQSISFRTFLGAPTLKWLFHESYWRNRPKLWELSMWGTPLELKERELDLNVHISLKLGRILHKNSGASCWKYPKHKPWKLSSKGAISPELNPWNRIFPGALDWNHSVGGQKTIFQRRLKTFSNQA